MCYASRWHGTLATETSLFDARPAAAEMTREAHGTYKNIKCILYMRKYIYHAKKKRKYKRSLAWKCTSMISVSFAGVATEFAKRSPRKLSGIAARYLATFPRNLRVSDLQLFPLPPDIPPDFVTRCSYPSSRPFPT